MSSLLGSLSRVTEDVKWVFVLFSGWSKVPAYSWHPQALTGCRVSIMLVVVLKGEMAAGQRQARQGAEGVPVLSPPPAPPDVPAGGGNQEQRRRRLDVGKFQVPHCREEQEDVKPALGKA